ncbi:thiamine-phosphate kinase [Novilysobacter spongiicola]|uniref:Thiamine-monophosphate kinase n=1 Tax=Lysobacter spongiicola DSM 21749 TaxID=1122188 RepID=A0A1T4RVT0_9GAMM|nr:thiamine-phosphate kinase [Lysobacter spongiicola]SKA19848.1 thiamine-monophosphate kinase [Lysobacter spongiicola DSM 21749]
MAEFDLIDRIRARAVVRDDVVLGIGDDGAVLQVPPGRQLVVATDTLNSGVHFPVDTAPADIGWKALAVNLSDLAAMGAEPAWCTLSLSLPEPDEQWLDGFLDGFGELATLHGLALVGGDTTRGPLSISVTLHGLVEPGRALRRDAAKAGDDVWVTGTLGDAAAALALLQERHTPALAMVCEAGPMLPAAAGQESAARALHEQLQARLDRPVPRVAIGRTLQGIAHAAIDLSDGLLSDLGHICAASGLGAEVDLDALPASAALRDAFQPPRRHALQAIGGDDYELCFTAPPKMAGRIETIAADAGVPITRIGRIVPGDRVRALQPDGQDWVPPRTGYTHFQD